MEFHLTPHAAQELLRRNIPRPFLDQVLADPQQIVVERQGRKAYQSRLDFGDGKVFLLRAIVDDSATPARVITAYRTSKIEKYWREP